MNDRTSKINSDQTRVNNQNRSIFQRLESHILRTVISGFFVAIPLLVTMLIIWYLVVFIDGFIRPLGWVTGKPYDFPGLGLILLVIIFYFIGSVATGRLGRKLIGWEGAILSRVPVVKTIYNVARQATSALSNPREHGFSRVVFIEWPRPGMMAMVFVTGNSHKSEDGEEVLVVYIPTAPNPTSGNMAFVSTDDIMDTHISVEDAMKLIFSGGTVLPSEWEKQVQSRLRKLPPSG